MYCVACRKFDTFQDVVRWAWEEYKINLTYMPKTEKDKQKACDELHSIVLDLYLNSIRKIVGVDF